MPNNELEIGACYEVLQRYTCKNRVTKSKVKMTRIKYLVNGKDVGRGTYLTCLEHNETRHCKNKTEALFQMRQPWVWCDGCAQINFNTERIDQFITNYIHAVSAGKVSVDVKPIQRPAEPFLEEDEFDSMPIEKINQYLREHGYNPEKVGLRGKILVEALTKNIIAREIIQRFLNKEGGCRFCEYDKYLPLDAPKNGHEESCLYLAARAYLDNDTSTVVKRDLSDAEIEELGAHEAESRGDK